MSKKEKKKLNQNKKIIIVISIIIALIILVLGGYLLYRHIELKKPLDVEWGQTYFEYLKDIKKNNQIELPDDLKNAKIGFYDVKEVKDPIMIIEYQKDNDTYSNVYYIEKNKVETVVFDKPTKIEFLYNIEKKEYNYYAHTTSNENETFSNVVSKINKEEDEIYNFEKDAKDTVTDVDGKEISISKKEEVFVETDIKDTQEDFETFLKEQVLKDILKKLIKKNKKQEEIEKQVQKDVDQKVEEVEAKQEEMKKATEEVEKKKEEEEEAKGLKIGSYRAKYGTYKITYEEDGSEDGKFTIKSDGSYTLTGKRFEIGGGRKISKTGKFHVGKIDISQGGSPTYISALCFESTLNGNKIDDGMNCIAIQGNNNFYQEMRKIIYVG